MECVRCGQPACEIKLGGMYLAVLCVDCRNEWASVFITTDEYEMRALQQGELAFLLSAAGGSGFDTTKSDDVEGVTKELLKGDQAIFDMGRDFMATDGELEPEDAPPAAIEETEGITKQPLPDDDSMVEELMADGSTRVRDVDTAITPVTPVAAAVEPETPAEEG